MSRELCIDASFLVHPALAYMAGGRVMPGRETLLYAAFVFLHVTFCEAIWPFASDDNHLRNSRPVQTNNPIAPLPHFEINEGRGKELAEQYARQNGLIESGSDCRQQAYAELQQSCREIMQVADMKHRLAIRFANCFAAESGKPTFPCPIGRSIKECTAPMNDLAHSSYRSFFIHVDAVCHHLQSEYFTQRTEGIVNRLVETSHATTEQLFVVSSKSEAILDQSKRSLALQRSLEQKQEGFRNMLEESMKDISSVTGRLREGVDDVVARQLNASRRQEEIAGEQAQAMSQLEVQTERVSEGVSRSLVGQEELLKGQAQAARRLTDLKEEQRRAFETHTDRLVELTGLAARHAQEVAAFQTGMEAAQERLATGSARMLEQQASFATKQAAVFSSLDRMFTLYGSIVSESMALKSLLFYAAAVTLAYTLTATKRTQNARFWLYGGLTANYAIEYALSRYFNPAEQAVAIAEAVWTARAVFGFYSLIVLGISCVTYRDFAALSYSLLEAQSAKLADIENRLTSPQHQQLSLVSSQDLRGQPKAELLTPTAVGLPRYMLEAIPEEEPSIYGLDVGDFRAVERTWSMESNTSDESYAPDQEVDWKGYRENGGYGLRQRPRPTWEAGQQVLKGESVKEFAVAVCAQSLYRKYLEGWVSQESSSSDGSWESESYSDSQQLEEALNDEASSQGPAVSSRRRKSSAVETPRATIAPRRGRRRSVM